jgi:hypothetical protein
MLLVGRRSSNGQPVVPFSDAEITNAILCAMELGSLMHSLLLAKRLRECLATLEPSADHHHINVP